MILYSRLILTLMLLFFWTLSARGSEPSLDPVYAGDTYVTGDSTLTSGLIAVYDTSYPARTKLGEGQANSKGWFAFSVQPVLLEGHTLVAEDALKNRSQVITILPPRVGPVPQPKQ